MKTIKKLESLKEFQLNNEMQDVQGGDVYKGTMTNGSGYNFTGNPTKEEQGGWSVSFYLGYNFAKSYTSDFQGQGYLDGQFMYNW